MNRPRPLQRHGGVFLVAALFAVGGCFPVRIAIGPGGEIATPLGVYRVDPTGSIVLGGRLDLWLRDQGVDPDDLAHFAWAPDGKQLAVLVSSKKFEGRLFLGRWPEDFGPTVERATWRSMSPGLLLSPEFSPDGRLLAFCRLTEVEGGDVLQLIVLEAARWSKDEGLAIDGMGWWPSWSPDGRRLAVVERDDASAHLVVVEASSGAARSILELPPKHPNVPKWRPDGSIDVLDPETERLLRIDPDAEEPRLVFSQPCGDTPGSVPVDAFAVAPGTLGGAIAAAEDELRRFACAIERCCQFLDGSARRLPWPFVWPGSPDRERGGEFGPPSVYPGAHVFRFR